MKRTSTIPKILTRVPIVLSFVLCLILFGCEPKVQEVVPEPFIPNSEHEGYLHGLETSGIAEKKLGHAFISQAIIDETKAVRIGASFREQLLITPDIHRAYQYKIDVERGQRIEVQLDLQLEKEIKSIYFLDVFRVSKDTTNQYIPVASKSNDALQLSFDVQESHTYIIRLQPELLTEDQVTIKIEKSPSMSFPVSGKNETAIGSLFGVPRDAGKRTHEGVDIFAKRHTPIIAPVSGKVTSTKDNERGGKVIWLRSKDNRSTLYFAHLESVFVKKDAIVNRGDTIGTVGNSGNAKTTYPHLHFGIYQKDAVDPYPFIVKKNKGFNRQLSYNKYLGSLIRTKKPTQFRKNNVLRKAEKVSIPENYIFEIIGTHAAYYKVALDDKNTGYIFYDDIESIDRPIRSLAMDQVNIEYARQDLSSPQLGQCCDDTTLQVLGYTRDFMLAADDHQTKHWLARSESN